MLAEYSNYNNVFSIENAAEIPENTKINEHAIELKNDRQPLFGSIYNLGLVELEILKTYIEINLANNFIHSSKSLTGASIFLDWKPNNSLHLCIDYWGLNNLTIKNWYPLLFIRELLNQLGWDKRFTQLDLTNTYHQMKIYKSNE